MSTGINIDYPTIIAIPIQVMSQQLMSTVNEAVSVHKPSPFRVVVPALQIVQSRIGIIEVASVSKGILSA